MKLRNKKTGEIADLSKAWHLADDGQQLYIEDTGAYKKCWNYDSLAELNEEWEDYEPKKEPLIKDEKVRKLVRAWAYANNCNGEVYHMTNWKCSSLIATGQKAEIKFSFELDGLEDTFYYTITELCGEEE